MWRETSGDNTLVTTPTATNSNNFLLFVVSLLHLHYHANSHSRSKSLDLIWDWGFSAYTLYISGIHWGLDLICSPQPNMPTTREVQDSSLFQTFYLHEMLGRVARGGWCTGKQSCELNQHTSRGTTRALPSQPHTTAGITTQIDVVALPTLQLANVGWINLLASPESLGWMLCFINAATTAIPSCWRYTNWINEKWSRCKLLETCPTDGIT